jgi:hypothetical protein
MKIDKKNLEDQSKTYIGLDDRKIYSLHCPEYVWEKDMKSKYEKNLDEMMKSSWNLHGLLDDLFI